MYHCEPLNILLQVLYKTTSTFLMFGCNSCRWFVNGGTFANIPSFWKCCISCWPSRSIQWACDKVQLICNLKICCSFMGCKIRTYDIARLLYTSGPTRNPNKFIWFSFIWCTWNTREYCNKCWLLHMIQVTPLPLILVLWLANGIATFSCNGKIDENGRNVSGFESSSAATTNRSVTCKYFDIPNLKNRML